MIVQHILQAKASNEVATIHADHSIAVAAKILYERRIGALVVTGESGSIIGILSERDIVRGMAVRGLACNSMKVSDLMTSNVLVCAPSDTLDSLMGIMTNKRIRHLPVIDKGHLVGMITIGDVVKSRLDETAQEVDHLREYVMSGG